MTAKSNKRIMERFTSEFLPTGDVTLAEAFLSSTSSCGWRSFACYWQTTSQRSENG